MWLLVLGGFVLAIAYFVWSILPPAKLTERIPKGSFNDKINDPQAKSRGWYDVIMIGGGPSGATCAYYLAKAGVHCAILDKAKFPRDKYCGDAVCKTAIEILMDMTNKKTGLSVYDQILKNGHGHVADSGGMVSPSGFSYVGRSHAVLGKVPAACAVKRIHLDNTIVMNSKDEGAELLENHLVEDAKFDEKENLWTVTAKVAGETKTFRCRTLVCADGAASGMGTKLGLITTPPDGVCSRAFISAGHGFKADGVVYYNKEILPGYAAIFRHPNDELNYCCYLIPGNPKVKNEDLKKWHDYLLNEDEALKSMLGPNYEIESMKGAGLRLGGVPKSWMKHGILIGDAAGLIDPMTGEGIHHAIESGKIAAETIIEAIQQGNYDSYELFHKRWMNAFGFDFAWSMKMCQVAYKFPIVLDAATAAVARKGPTFLAKWAEIMTGRVPKIYLFKPEYSIPVAFELIKMLINPAARKPQKK